MMQDSGFSELIAYPMLIKVVMLQLVGKSQWTMAHNYTTPDVDFILMHWFPVLYR